MLHMFQQSYEFLVPQFQFFVRVLDIHATEVGCYAPGGRRSCARQRQVPAVRCQPQKTAISPPVQFSDKVLDKPAMMQRLVGWSRQKYRGGAAVAGYLQGRRLPFRTRCSAVAVHRQGGRCPLLRSSTWGPWQ